MLQVIIPAYNEEKRLPRTLTALRRYLVSRRGVLGPVDVYVVDNDSTDRTAAIARASSAPPMPVRVLTCGRRGKGAAVRAGMLASRGEVVAIMDADGATALRALEEAWWLIQGGAEVVIGSRGLPGSLVNARASRTRAIGADLYRRLARQLVPGITDTQCGFKVISGDLARHVAGDLTTRGFSFDVELLRRLRAAGAAIEEIPVEWTDVAGSTFRPARHGVSAFAELAAIAWHTRRPYVVKGPSDPDCRLSA